MKQMAAVAVVIATLVGGATWYGLTRGGGSAAPKPETSQKLLLAEKFLEQNDPAKTLEILKDLETEGARTGEKGALLQLDALDRSGKHAEAKVAAEAFLKTYPESADKTKAELIRLSAELATAGFTNPALRQSVDQFLAANPDHPGAVKLHIALARQEIAVGDHPAAQRRLATVMASTTDDAAVVELAQPLGKANLDRLYSSAVSDGDKTHTVAKGESVNVIARANKVTDELLLKCNGIDDPRKLRIGQKLKVPNVNFSLKVDIAANTMTLKNHGEFFKLYRVRTGRDAGTTTTGEFKILNKKGNPTWRPGNGHTYLPGDPNNELGTRWMSYEGDILGIHGTLHPETVGEYASNGCVGMTRADVEELFDLVMVGTPLTIVGKQDLTRHRVIPAPKVPEPQQIAKN